ncbi:hypothetical protein ACHWQZ_G016243 [Mnemiopsis leidyi]
MIMTFFCCDSFGRNGGQICNTCLTCRNNNLPDDLFKQIRERIERCYEVDGTTTAITDEGSRTTDMGEYFVDETTSCSGSTAPELVTSPALSSSDPNSVGVTAAVGAGGCLIVGILACVIVKLKCWRSCTCRSRRHPHRDCETTDGEDPDSERPPFGDDLTLDI